MHLLPDEVPLSDNIPHWNYKLTVGEKSLLTQIFRFFIQPYIDVAGCYVRLYITVSKLVQVQIMLMVFMNIHAIHIRAYIFAWLCENTRD
jgi:ribonucleoside-diphosphate reductase beta chain